MFIMKRTHKHFQTFVLSMHKNLKHLKVKEITTNPTEIKVRKTLAHPKQKNPSKKVIAVTLKIVFTILA